MAIPDEYHFICGMTPTDRPFSFIHYIAVKSCIEINHPSRATVYYTYEPSGRWWGCVKKLVTLVRVPEMREIYCRPLLRPEHRSDVLRLQILHEYGGVYLDTDVLCIKPFSELLTHEVVLGEEYGLGICNAVILAKPRSPFIARWLLEYQSFDPTKWNEHSVLLPKRLAGGDESVTVLDHTRFFWPMYRDNCADLRAFFFSEGTSFCRESYCVHLWEGLTGSFTRQLEPGLLWKLDSEFFLLARRFLGERETEALPYFSF